MPGCKRRGAIRNTLGRLGMQATIDEVILAVAARGVAVTAEAVRQVRLDLVRQTADSRKHRTTVADVGRRRAVPRPQKVPGRRWR